MLQSATVHDTSHFEIVKLQPSETYFIRISFILENHSYALMTENAGWNSPSND